MIDKKFVGSPQLIELAYKCKCSQADLISTTKNLPLGLDPLIVVSLKLAIISQFGGMDVSEAKRLRTLEDENTKLKRLLAEAMLDNTEGPLGKEVVTPAGKRKAVVHLRETFGMSERRACKAIGCCRMTTRYRTTRTDDADLRQRMRAIAQERRRFGYRRLHVLLRREGYLINHKKLFRLYREEKLTVRRRGGRKRAIGTRAPMLVPLMPNDRWSLDFVSDQLTDGRRFPS